MHLKTFMLRDLDKWHLDLQYINKEEKEWKKKLLLDYYYYLKKIYKVFKESCSLNSD